MSQYLAYSLEH